MSDITNHSLKEIIDNMKSKKISSYELTQKYIKNIEGAKKLNTFVTTTFEQALDKDVVLQEIQGIFSDLEQMQAENDKEIKKINEIKIADSVA